MRRWLLSLLMLAMLVPLSAEAEGPGPKKNCVDLDSTPVINGLALTSDRAFTFAHTHAGGTVDGSYDLMDVYVTLVDANSSITSLTMTCTGSDDSNTTLNTPFDCISSAGTITCSATGVFPFPTPGSSSWHFSVDITNVPDGTCTWHVATGSAAAGDLLTIKRRMCVK